MASHTKKMDVVAAGLVSFLLGPIGLIVVLWKCVSPAAGLVMIAISVAAFGGLYFLSTQASDTVSNDSDLASADPTGAAPEGIEDPVEDSTSGELSWLDYDCDDLATETETLGANAAGYELLKVRKPTVVKDNRLTYDVPNGAGQSLILRCDGTGVFNSGDVLRVCPRVG